jgi:uncharacterized repeat protein (TIGR01451 family)
MLNTFSKTIPIACAILASCTIAATAQAQPSELWACKGVTIEQSGPTSIKTGEILEYEIRIRNGGSCNLENLDVTDFIPRMSEFHQASPQPTDYPRPLGNGTHPVLKIQWKKVALSAGGDVTFKITAIVKSPEDRVLLNTACFESDQTGRICSEFETTVEQ